jgi:quercetin dioxygenase-like cupin family protein
MMAQLQRIGFGIAIAGTALAACRALPAQTSAGTPPRQAAAARPVFSHELPSLDGRHLKVTIVEVAYGPGGSSPAHSHPCAVIGHVVQGALRTQVKGEPEAVYRAGQSFYEGPNGVHLVSANASDKDSVRFLAYFTCDHETPLSVPATDSQPGRPQ